MTKGDIMSGWHLKKEVTVGQIITLVTLLISGIWWASTVETRLTESAGDRVRIEQKTDIIIDGMTDRYDRQEAMMNSIFTRIERHLERIEEKLDGKADKE